MNVSTRSVVCGRATEQHGLAQGLLRKVYYVPAELVDLAVAQGLQICVGLGAGRPELGTRVIAEAFRNNPWTTESTADLLEMLRAADDDVSRHPDLPPWGAILAEHTLTAFMSEIEWVKLGQQEVGMIWTMLSAKAAYWGLSHEDSVPDAFEAEKSHYEQTAPEAARHGLAVPTKFPWSTLDDFYGSCEEIVKSFESERPPLSAIPEALRNAPAIARRL